MATYTESPVPSFLFDLDGTLIDSVYQHVIAWRTALSRIGIDLSVWRIHRRIGMSGGLFVSALLRETGRSLSKADIDALQHAHAAEYRAQMDSVTPLPGARELLAALTDAGVRWAIATSGYAATARPALALLGLPEDTPMITRDLVRHAKPDPDLFLAAAAELGVEPRHAMVVGDSVWDLLAARRAGTLGVGLMSGGYGREELERAGTPRREQVPHAVADDHRVPGIHVELGRRGQEQVGVRLGVPHQVAGDHRGVFRQPEQGQRGPRRGRVPAGRDGPAHARVGERAEQLTRPGQGRDRVHLRTVLRRVRLLQPVDVGLGQRSSRFPQQRGHEQPAAHPDPPVDPPHGQVDADARQRRPPGDDVLVDAVDQRPVQVEEERRSR